MRTALLAAFVALSAPSADAGGPNSFVFLALEPPPVHLAGGYVIQLQPAVGDSGRLFDQALSLHLQDPYRGAPASRRAARTPRGPGPDHFAVLQAPGLLATAGGLAAAPDVGPAQRLVVQVLVEDAEFWEAWQIDQAHLDSGAPGSWNFCLARDATVHAQLRAFDGVDGRLVAQQDVEHVESASDCGANREDAMMRVTPEASLAEFAVDGLARLVADRVAPRWVAVEARLVRKGGAGRGHKLVRSGDLPAATRWYVDASSSSPQDPWLRYHAAVLLTAGFHFGPAREHLSAARDLADEPIFADWEEELHRRERAALMLRRMGVPQEPLRY